MSSKKTTKTKSKQRKPKKISAKDKTGDIKEASIAKFMRKRTQLVGFDYGNFKHTQYAVEFMDNALDAIEKFHWDAVTNLEKLKNNTASTIAEFERFDFEAELLLQNSSDPGFNGVDVLKKLYKGVPNIIKKIQKIKEEIHDVVGIGYGESSSIEKSSLKGAVTSTNFQQKLDEFKEEYHNLRKEYTTIIHQIDGMEKNPQFIFTLDQELSLQNLSYIANSVPESKFKRKLNDSLKKNLRNLMESNGKSPLPSAESSDVITEEKSASPVIEEIDSLEQTLNLSAIQQELSLDEDLDDDEVKELQKLQKKEKDLEEELQTLVDHLDQFIAPVADIVDNEPLVIVKLSEDEPPDVYRERGARSDSYLYTIEVFDNGTGMRPEDLMKFGKYLASSKSQKLRQTRGSQGFGSPSAFSDAQNTTGKPITVISKHSSQLYGVCSEFFTTEKNTKVYVVDPVEVETPFIHGTYVKLHYLNKKYNRGYVDAYIEKTAQMNSHISFIYIDPKNPPEEHFYPRRVPYFPKEPKYALPHPSSIKIGDFQDLLRASENHAVKSFLTENFVRVSSKLAKAITEYSEFEIECKLRFFNLEIGFLSAISKPTDIMTFTRQESRIYGRSSKPRMKYVAYFIENDLKDSLWEPIQEFNQLMKKRHTLTKTQKITEKSLNLPDQKKKDLKELKKSLKQASKELDVVERNIIKIKKNLTEILKSAKLTNEIKHSQTIQKIEEIIGYLQISKTKPADLTQIQIEHLYMAFKKQTYLSPPTDTAIPVGESALETAVIKQYNLTVSNRVDFFGNSEDFIQQIGEYDRANSINKNLSKFNNPNLMTANDLDFSYYPAIKPDAYSEAISELDLVHTIGDDFIAAHTRRPTSGKGLAFVVEAVMAYSPNKIPTAKKASQVVTRYVNRTPKMRDNADCALWQGIQSVKWKSYKVADTFDNGIPKGNCVIYINCSGPYTHLMFKSQSKNALAEDEILVREVKFCLEAIGRKLRKYMNKKEIRDRRSKRSKVIEKNIPIFVTSIYNIAKFDNKYQNLKKSTLEQKINEVLSKESDPTASEKEIRDAKKASVPTPILSKMIAKSRNIPKSEPPASPPSSTSPITKLTPTPKTELSTRPKTTTTQSVKPKESKPSSPTVSSELTNTRILEALSDNSWHPTSDIVKSLAIVNFSDARYLKLKLKALAMKGRILRGIKQGKDVWKIK